MVNVFIMICTVISHFAIFHRKTLQEFLLARKTSEGAFTMHGGGEVDVRGAYCALSAARLTNIVTPELVDGAAEWVVRLDTSVLHQIGFNFFYFWSHIQVMHSDI